MRVEACAITDHDGEVVLYRPNDSGFETVKGSLDSQAICRSVYAQNPV